MQYSILDVALKQKTAEEKLVKSEWSIEFS